MRTLRLRRRGAVVAGAVLVAGLAVGGSTAYAVSTDSPSTPAPAEKAHKHRWGAHHRWAHHRWGGGPMGPMFRRGPGVHGEATVKDRKTGRWVDREWQRGQVTGVSGKTVSVKSKDGATWQWTLSGATSIKRGGKSVAESALQKGDAVFVVGTKDGSVNDARRVFAPSKAQIAKFGKMLRDHKERFGGAARRHGPATP